MDGRTTELGLGAVAVSPRPYVNENWAQAAQLWLTARTLPSLHLSAITAFDDQAIAVGGAMRFMFIQHDRFVAGGELELGYAWAGLDLPIAARILEQNWIYLSPRVANYGIEPMFALPIGLNLHVERGLILRAEYTTSWVNMLAYEHRSHLGTAVVVQW